MPLPAQIAHALSHPSMFARVDKAAEVAVAVWLELDLSLTTASGQVRRLATRTTAETVNGQCRMMA